MRVCKIIIIIFLAVFFLSGCGNLSQPDKNVAQEEPVSVEVSEYIEEALNDAGDSYFYFATKNNIDYDLQPIEDEWIQKYEYRVSYKMPLIESKHQEDVYFSRRDTKVIGDKLYILDDVCGQKTTGYYVDGVRYDYDYPECQLYGYLLTIITPDEENESVLIKRTDLDSEGKIRIVEIAGVSDRGEIYFYLYQGNTADDYYLGIYDGEGFRTTEALSEKYRNKYSCVDGNELYFYGERDSRGLSADKNLSYVNLQTDAGGTKNYDFYIKGYSYPEAGNCLIYGVDETGRFYIFDSPYDEKGRAIQLDLVAYGFEKGTYQVAEKDDVIYITDGNIIWTVVGDICVGYNLSESGILADKVYGMSAKKDGLYIYARYNGDEIVYDTKLMKGVKSEKKKVRYAVAYKNPIMQEFITVYNINNPVYEIVLDTGRPDQTKDEFEQEIILQTVAHEGPELIDDLLVDPLQPCRNGTYAILDDLVEENENNDIIKPILESGKIDGHQYGIPWQSTLFYCAAPRDLVGDRKCWNLSECMDLYRDSDYSLFGINVNSMMTPQKIIMYLGLYDTDNKELIDWEEGKSNLESEKFIELLKFAKEYGSDEAYFNVQNDEAEYSRVCQAGCDYCDELSWVNFDYYQGLYRAGDRKWIGFPGEKNSSAYVYTACAYVNEGSENKEGAKEFLAYLISEEGQALYAQIALKHAEYTALSVSMSVVDEFIKNYNIEVARTEKIFKDRHNSIALEPLTDEMIYEYKSQLLNARYIRKDIGPIEEIVEEELNAFLEEQKSAEETAKVIDSRVQLYLDENR